MPKRNMYIKHMLLICLDMAYKIIYGLPRLTFFGYEWGDSPMTFTSDTVTGGNL